MFFRSPNIQARYNEAVLCLKFGTPENYEFSIWDKWKIFSFLGVPILKHIRVFFNLRGYFEISVFEITRFHCSYLKRNITGK